MFINNFYLLILISIVINNNKSNNYNNIMDNSSFQFSFHSRIRYPINNQQFQLLLFGRQTSNPKCTENNMDEPNHKDEIELRNRWKAQ